VSHLERPGVQAIKHLLLDPEISEIMINGSRFLFVERGGVMQQLHPVFTSKQQLDLLVENLVALTGRAVNAKQPFVDFRMPDGARVNVVISPVALDGPVITIRKATRTLRTLDDLVARGTLTDRMAFFLFTCVRARLNILFSGGTASGKTTTLGMLSAYIPEGERIVVIEDTAELELRQPHVVRMECRPPNLEGAGAITLSDLLRNSLRMRPTRIIVGEVRGEEAFDMLNAMSSGHDGCLAVIHASSPSHAVARLEMMVLTRGLPLPVWSIQRQIAGALHVVVQHSLLSDGTRRITKITEVVGAKDDHVQLRDLFVFEQHGYDAMGVVQGGFRCTGEHPAFLDALRMLGGDGVLQSLEAG
jgi:pilus assembly protein CpaF